MGAAIAEPFHNVRRRRGRGRRGCGGPSRTCGRGFPLVCSVFLAIRLWIDGRGQIGRCSTRRTCRFASRFRTCRALLRDCCRAHIGPFHPAAEPPTDVRPMQRTIRRERRPAGGGVQSSRFPPVRITSEKQSSSDSGSDRPAPPADWGSPSPQGRLEVGSDTRDE